MPRRHYGQYCGLVRALEIVGERWALLIIRDLLVGPRRYTDLLEGLPGIPTNILASRLKGLEAEGVVRRRAQPRPPGGVVYELTERGAELEPALIQLGRWGARLLGEPGADEVVTADSMVMALRTTFRREAAAGPGATWELRMGPVVLHARVEDAELEVAAGQHPEADLVIEAGPPIRALMAGEITAEEAIRSGAVRVRGDPALLARFAEIFRI